MNALERIVQDDLNHLIDRIASTTEHGMVADCIERRLELVARLEEAERQLSSARQALLQAYGSWRQALQQCGDLWALVDHDDQPMISGERRAA
jgi:hypothetical protein